ncbi:MAG: RloB family protein [Pseudomonadota bacterium]
MGRDNQPRERQLNKLARKQTSRAEYDRILIVSEGRKTEPLYFGDICAHYRLHSANVQVRPSEFGTAPIQVVQYAQQLLKKGDNHKGIRPLAFERVYVVFDRDDHESYFEALKLSESLDKKIRNDDKKPVRFIAIASVPSFELWLLLHFEDVLAPLHRDDVMRRLKTHIPGYGKGVDGIFALTRGQLASAMRRADALRAKKFDAYTAPEPFTGVADLVQVLTSLRKDPEGD